MVVRWAPIPDTQDLYEASTEGVMLSHDRIVVQKNGMERFKRGANPLLPRVNDSGYHEYSLYVPGRPRRVVQGQVLMLEAFVGPRPPGKPHIRHLDGTPGNNRLENLAYATAVENRADMILHGRDHYASRDACKWRHAFTPENTRDPKLSESPNKRICRSCNAATGALFRDGTDRKAEPDLFQAISDFYFDVVSRGGEVRGCLSPAQYYCIKRAVQAGRGEAA